MNTIKSCFTHILSILEFIRKKSGLFIFLKAQSASVCSSILDFSITIFLTEIIGIWYGFSSVTGTFSGGIVSFLLNRTWVFRTVDENKFVQIQRFVLVWISSLILNFSGLLLLTKYLNINYLISKIIISIIVGILFRYNLHRIFVFKKVEN
ncbi:MAG: GtrA family protein [Bacteroidota bacterium]|nr:GtrA family protein [Bacteroidota bacterium]